MLLMWCWLVPAMADQNDKRLDPLFERLQLTDDGAEAQRVTQEIWAIWYEIDRERERAGQNAATRTAIPATDRRTCLPPTFLLYYFFIFRRLPAGHSLKTGSGRFSAYNVSC